MNQKIAFALNDFIDMSKGDQQEYLDTLTDYVFARPDEKAETTETMRKLLNQPAFAAHAEFIAVAPTAVI